MQLNNENHNTNTNEKYNELPQILCSKCEKDDCDCIDDFSSYSKEELIQLRTLTMQSYNHYLTILKETNLRELDRYAFNLCKKESENDLNMIDAALEKMNQVVSQTESTNGEVSDKNK